MADRAQMERFADLLMPGWRDRVAGGTEHAGVRFLPEMTVTHGLAGVESYWEFLERIRLG